LRVDAWKPEPPNEVEATAVFAIRFCVASWREERTRPNKASHTDAAKFRDDFHGLFSARVDSAFIVVVFVTGLLSPFSHLIQEESVRFTQKDSPREDKAKPIS
jgi:hypothetical protein